MKSLNIRPVPAKPASDPEHQITHLLGSSSLCMLRKVAPCTTVNNGKRINGLPWSLAYCLNQAIFIFHSNHPLHTQNKTVRSGKDMELTLKSKPKPLHFRESWNSYWWHSCSSMYMMYHVGIPCDIWKEICRVPVKIDLKILKLNKSFGGNPCLWGILNFGNQNI